MGFPVQTIDGDIIEVEKSAETGEMVDADGNVYVAAAGQSLRVELKEAGAAIDAVADEAAEAVSEVVSEVKEAGTEIGEAVGDLIEAAEDAAEQIGDVIDAAGDVVEEIADDPVGAISELIDDFGDDEEAPNGEAEAPEATA